MRQFFEGDNGLLSMGRLVMFIACLGSTAVILWITHNDKLSSEIFAMYCMTWGGAYVGGKFLDNQKA